MSDKATSLTYDQLSNRERVYMFEFILPEAIRAVMSVAEITAYTNFVPPELQLERPRVEISFVTGAGQGRYHPVQLKESAWKGQFTLQLITGADMAVHGRFVSEVRRLMHGPASSFNETAPMVNHNFRPPVDSVSCSCFMDQGSTPVMKSQDGYYQTNLVYETDFAIQDNAWALLTA